MSEELTPINEHAKQAEFHLDCAARLQDMGGSPDHFRLAAAQMEAILAVAYELKRIADKLDQFSLVGLPVENVHG